MEKKIKITEFIETPWEGRWKALQDLLKSDHQILLEADFIKPSQVEFVASAQKVLNSEAQIIKLNDNYATEILKILPQTTQASALIGAADYLIRDNRGWWPKIFLPQSFTKVLSENIGQLDLSAFALVVGATSQARMVISSLAKIGYSTINVVDDSATLGLAFIDEMKRKFFQINFSFVRFSDITTLPGVHSIVVNTLPLIFEREYMDELYFFNYLKQKSVAIDLSLMPLGTPMIEESKQWGARHLSGDLFSCETDAMMVESFFQKKVDTNKYKSTFKAVADATPSDIAPFLKRFRDRGNC